MTMWGDDGAECSYYAVLPSLYAMKRIYDGEEDIEHFNHLIFVCMVKWYI